MASTKRNTKGRLSKTSAPSSNAASSIAESATPPIVSTVPEVTAEQNNQSDVQEADVAGTECVVSLGATIDSLINTGEGEVLGGDETGDGVVDGLQYSDTSPISLSLLNAMNPTLIVGRQLLATVDTSQPHVTSKMPDGAKYWLTTGGDVLVVRLPCLIDMTVQGVRIGKYFDLFGEEITDDKFKKLRAVFGFRSLPDDSDMYPTEVLKTASACQKLLYKLQTKFESNAAQRNQHASTIRGFYKAEMAQDCFQYLIRSEPIFTPAADPAGGASGIPAIDLSGDTDSDSGSDLIFSSPSKLRAQAASRTAATNKLQFVKSGYTLGDWAQPAHACTRYHHLVGDRTHLWASRFNIPDIRDQNGTIVHPTKWETVLAHLAPVTVDFALKLWDIPAGRGREGSRIYQLVLRKVQIHPVNTLSASVVSPLFAKGKRRAGMDTDALDIEGDETPPSPTKKSKSSAMRGSVGDKDVVMGM